MTRKMPPALFPGLVLLLALVGCEPMNQGKALADVVPMFGISQLSQAKVVTSTTAPFSEAFDSPYMQACFQFYHALWAPQLVGFSAVDGGVQEGDTFESSLLGTTITITASALSDGTNGIATGVRYSGILKDGSGHLELDYDPTTKEFAYSQCIYVDNQAQLMGPYSKAISYSTLRGKLGANNECLASGSVGMFVNGTGQSQGAIPYTQRSAVFFPYCEVYFGPWTAGSTSSGAGFAKKQVVSNSALESTDGPAASAASPLSIAQLPETESWLKTYLAERIPSDWRTSSQSPLMGFYKTTESNTVYGLGYFSSDNSSSDLVSSYWAASTKLFP